MGSHATFKRNPRLGSELARQVADVVAQGGFVMERETKRRTPVDTGALRNGFHTDIEVNGKTVHVTVGNNVSYAPYVEFGTSRMAGRHMLSNGLQAAARWLARRGFKVDYEARR